ncbi:hypothetical protein Cantr_05773 [Candida viswanathii]|uniref:Uncharacterized protein n=1 Tax=Candida viswanathii TaxID=5486 RepID=A0A367XRE3_9ASCO|nr:hypothetical protein Cantr_05773 [Candida viswanathii]
MDSLLEHSGACHSQSLQRDLLIELIPYRSHSHPYRISTSKSPIFQYSSTFARTISTRNKRDPIQQVHYEKAEVEPNRQRQRIERLYTTKSHIFDTNNTIRIANPRSRTSLTPMQSGRSSRRRSSIIVTKEGEKVYRPEYQGPITLDYLRFFCKALIQSEEMVRTKRQELDNPFIDKNSSMPGVEVEEEEDTVEDIR